MRFIFLPALFALPLVEIAVFIKVGEWLGVPLTIALIVLSAVVGLGIVRWQGLTLLTKARDSLKQNTMPVGSVVHGTFLLVAGILLAIPGFVTDIVAFALLVPALRMIIARFVLEKLRRAANVSVHVSNTRMRGREEPFRPAGEGPLIEGEVVEDLTPSGTPPRGDSGSSGDPSGEQQPPSPWRP